MKCIGRLLYIVPKSNTTCGLAAYGTSNGTGSGITPTSAGNVFIQTYSGVNNQLWYIEEFNGRHEEYYANLTSLMYPFENASVAKTVNSGYGYRLNPIELIDKFHNGIDMPTSEGTELYPMFKVGKVVKCGYDSSMGNYIYIESNYNYAYGTTTKLRSVYMHMREPTSFSVGSNVRFNEVVGYVGTTGSSTGNHLHLAMIILTACSKLIESDNVNSGSTKQYDSFADITIGGGDFTFDRIFIESTCDTAFFDRIIGVEELTKFINEEIEPNKLKRQSVPIVYKIIQHFDIPKETVIEHNKKTIAFNKENGTNTTTFDDYIIDALYCNDEEKMKKTLKSPYVLYQNQKFYTIYDVIKMSPEKLLALGLSQESLLLYSSELEDAFKSFGYDSEATKEAFKKLTTNIKSIQKNN